jgi:membrane protease YdiL (CAAX protease family)
MTVSSPAAGFARFEVAPGWVAGLAIGAGLAAAVAARLTGTRGGLDGLVIGVAFGGALMALAFAGGVRPGRIRATPLAIGAGVGLALAALTVVGPAIAGATYVPGLGRPAAPFVPWALITIVVASAEEGVLRGALFDRMDRVAGVAPAIVATTVAFALMHVPLYGWHVVPLDLAVGFLLAGLRLGTRGLVAPAAAHVVADLATWWL